MTTTRATPITLAAALLATGVVTWGCADRPGGRPAGRTGAGAGGGGDDPNSFANVWPSPSYNPVPQSDRLLLMKGRPPLLYQAKQSASLEIVDGSTGQTLGAVDARPGMVVRLDSRKGILAGGEVVRGDGISDGHEYLIYAPASPDEPWRSGVRVAPTPRPATARPAAGP